jgi:serine/threonine protein kinase
MPDQPEKKREAGSGPLSDTEPGLGWEPDRPPGKADPSLDESGVKDALERVKGRGSQSGRVLKGLYQLEELIGEGGMGSVYAARHLHLQKRFAVKLFRNAQETSDSSLARFRQEAIAASRIDHPHIIDVVNFDLTEDGTVFMVMELLEGKNLAELLYDGPIPIPRSLALVRQMGDALAAAHQRGIVHRDLKPENVLVVERNGEEFVKILDFGISKMRAEGEDKVRITRTGQVLGTPRYISPEQARGEGEIDHRADIYALGAILYEMLCGQPPFEGRNYAHLLWQHANSEPPLLGKRMKSALPPALEKAVMRSLQKEPDRRFKTVTAMVEALERAAADTTSSAMAAIRPPVSRRAAGVGTAAVLVLAGVFWWSGRGDTASKEEMESASPSSAEKAGEAEEPVAEAPAAAAEVDEGKAPAPGAPDQTAAAADAPGQAKAEPVEQAPEPAVATVTMRFESQPGGATVKVEGETAGKTPLSLPVRADKEPLRVVFSAPGYRERVVTVTPAEDKLVRARLRRVQVRKQPGPALPIKKSFR